MPTAPRPARRGLRANTALIKDSCAHGGNGIQLCVDGVLQTGDIGLASLW